MAPGAHCQASPVNGVRYRAMPISMTSNFNDRIAFNLISQCGEQLQGEIKLMLMIRPWIKFYREVVSVAQCG